MRSPLAALSLVVLHGLGSAQTKMGNPDADLRLDYGVMQREKEVHAVREETLIHLLIRHSLGLRADADVYLKLDESEIGISETVARKQLLGLQRDIARGAATLRAKEKLFPVPPPSAAGDPSRAPVQRHRARPVNLTTVRARSVTIPSQKKPGLATARTVQAIIMGSIDRSAVGRVLFKAGKWDAALREFSPLENDKKAALGDLFYLARCYEELHNVAKRQATAAAVAAAKSKVTADQAAKASGELREQGLHLRSSGGTEESVDKYERFVALQKVVNQEMTDHTVEMKAARKLAADRYLKAYDIFILIEGRNIVKSKDGDDAPGEWANAARSARNMMKWIETNKVWTASEINWSTK